MVSSTCTPSSVPTASTGRRRPLSVEQLARASLSAARAVSVAHASGITRWGNQVDVQLLDRTDEQRAQKVAQYVAKYATKSSAESGARSTVASRRRRTSPAGRSVRTCEEWPRWRGRLAATKGFTHLHLRRHAHSLGYGGHFLSKSRRYSTSFRALKADRVAWRSRQRHGVATDRPFCRGTVACRGQSAGPVRVRPCSPASSNDQRAVEIRLANEEWYGRH